MVRRLSIGLLLAAALVATTGAGAPRRPATPERVEPLRKRILTPERYRELRAEWKAYTDAHPTDALGWIQLAKAGSYAGDSCGRLIEYAERAVRLAPDDADALALLGGWKWSMYCGGQPVDASEAIRLLERALRINPDLDDPHVRLWVMRLSKGQNEAAADELRSLLDRGRLPEPLVDFGYNLLVSLEPNAILLTNGDNDTCPTLALQAARGFRSDVAVVNLSLLNLGWYRRALREGRLAVPVPLLDQSPSAVGGSDDAVRGLIGSLDRAGWKRPLYMACTVDYNDHQMPNALSLEGVVYRVLRKREPGFAVDTTRTLRNLRQRYRIESATSPALDWEAWSAVRILMRNYTAPELQVAMTRARAGNRAGVAENMEHALALTEFHHSPYVRDLISMWEHWDPRAPGLARWKKQLGL